MVENKIFYSKPPSKLKLKRRYYRGFHNLWEQTALPLGNGSLGMTVLGDVKSDKTVLNEKTLWVGGPSPKRPDYSGGNITKPDQNNKMPYDYYNEIREEFLKGNDEKASRLCEKLVGVEEGYGAYQCWGMFNFTFTDIKSYKNYNRTLDMEKALCTVSYDAYVSGRYVRDRREYFVSHPHKCGVICLERDGGKQSFTMELADGHSSEIVFLNDGSFYQKGQLDDNSLKLCLVGKIVTDGKIIIGRNSVSVNDAQKTAIIFSAGTDYTDSYPKYRTGESSEELFERIQKTCDYAVGQGVNKLKTEHINDFKSLFNRVSLDLDGKENISAERLVRGYNSSFACSDKRAAEQLLYQLGRYFTISSSREDDILPSNLQGIWCVSNSPKWSSDFHLNINLQMNYWCTYNGNLSECAKPLIRYIKSLTVPGRLTAQYYTNVKSDENSHNGFLFHTQNTPFGWTCPGWVFDWGWSPAAVPWILHNIYEYYEYTLDKQMLKDEIYPLLKETAVYFEKLLVPYKDRLVTAPCFSPEHGPRTMGNTYEQSLISQLYSDAIECAKALDTDRELQEKWKELNSRLKPYELGDDGQIKEWYSETKLGSIGQKHHRHMSHLLGVYPCNVINWYKDPELIKGAIVSMNHRTDKSTGWSMGQKINTWARVGDGDRVLKIIGTLFKSGIYPNFWDLHPPFQIDGNFGFTSGVNEMLIQSHCGFIDLLPALPSQWTKGSIKGIVTRGNFEISMEWDKGVLKQAVIKSNMGGKLKLHYGKSRFSVSGVESENNFVQIDTEKDGEYVVNPLP